MSNDDAGGTSMTTTNLAQRVVRPGPWIFWIYLLLLTAAELLSASSVPRSGLVLHATILVTLLIHAGLTSSVEERRLALGLILAPMIRLLSLSLPLPSLPQSLWYPTVAVPLLITTALIIRQVHVSPREIGLSGRGFLLQLPLAGIGIALGVVEYAILKPAPLIDARGWESILLPALSLLIFTGLTEELIFRGLLQSVSPPVVGRLALVYVSLLFAVLHIGYRSVADFVFVFTVGLGFAFVVHWSGSILGVTLAHGVTNTTLFLVMPNLVQHSVLQSRIVLALAIVWGTVLAGVSTSIFIVRAGFKDELMVQEPRRGKARVDPELALVAHDSEPPPVAR